MIDPVVHLEEANPKYVGWRGRGWYWIDPEYLAGRYSLPAGVTGPYADAALAMREYYALLRSNDDLIR